MLTSVNPDQRAPANHLIRLINEADEFSRTVVAEAREPKLTSDEHFTVDGTLIEAWASLQSFPPKVSNAAIARPPMIPAIRESADSGRASATISPTC
jgi:hypothetical protein